MYSLTPSEQPQKQQPKHLWLCLSFTHLSLNSLGIDKHSQPAQAIIEQQKIWQTNQSAAESGVRIGMSINHALTLNSSLILLARDPAKETQKYRDLSYWAYRFSSFVSTYSTQSLLIEIGASINLFNGLENLIKLIKHDLSGFKISYSMSIANTPKAAYALSVNPSTQINTNADLAHSQLQQLELAKLELNNKTIKQLQACGFNYLKDIQTIPLAELGQRFGTDFLTYIKQLNGSLADPQIRITPPETFKQNIDFAEPISNILWIQQQLDLLLIKLLDFIKQRQLVCHSFSWRFSNTVSQYEKVIDVALSSQQNQLTTLQELSDLKFSNIKLERAFSSIELSSHDLSPKQLQHKDLFSPLADDDAFNHLSDRLRNKLGQKSIYQIQIKPEHLPELANQQVYTHAQVNQMTSPSCTSTQLDQPISLLTHPQKLAQRSRQPYLQGPLTIIHGPNRICSQWWEKLQSRDYYISRQHNGRLLWIFYDRVQQNWYLHGLFT